MLEQNNSANSTDIYTDLSNDRRVPTFVYAAIGLILLAVVVVSVLALQNFSDNANLNELSTAPAANMAPPEFDALHNSEGIDFNYTFSYSLVPDAPSKISLPDPVANESDLSQYRQTQAGEVTVASSFIGAPAHQNLRLPNGQSLTDFINYHPNREVVFTVVDEMSMLTKELASTYNRATLAERFPDSVDGERLTAFRASAHQPLTVYPNEQVTQAVLLTKLLVETDPDNAATYESLLETYVSQGTYIGLYGASDIAAARSVVEQYFSLLDATTKAQLITSPQAVNL